MESRRRKYIIIASILLHILFFALWEAGVFMDLFSQSMPEKVLDSEPIVFEIQQPDTQQPQPREVIETPEDAKVVEKQEKAKFLSDKNALARNPETNPNLEVGEAFSRGDLDSHELPKHEGPLGKTLEPPKPESQQTEQQPKEPEEKPETEDTLANILRRALTNPQVLSGIQERLPTVRHNNQDLRAEDMGGLSFNTYDWNFAPYLLMLKRKIQRNIFPPPAFSQLGIINGDTVLRFKIYPNGVMRDLEILGYNGHESLMITSRNAVDSSAPFPALPLDFPEPFLEVTGKFIYFVRR